MNATRLAAPLRDAQVIAVGVLALAVAMGIGRFAFTPLMPLMLRDATIDAATAAEWAAANYVGYLLGALTASRFSGDPLRGLRIATLGVAAATLAIVPVHGSLPDLAGAALRLAAGVFGAWTMVCASVWCLGELGRRGAGPRGAWIYTGVGLGILVTGTIAWLGGTQSARALWLELGLLAAAAAVVVTFRLRGAAGGEPGPDDAPAGGGRARRGRRETGIVLAYAALGFGYIVPATFLPAMAREQVADPRVFGIAWPLFGLAAVASVAAAARYLPGWSRSRVWALALFAMAAGTALPLVTRTLWALAASAVLVGGTLMVATMAGLQLARERAPADPTRLQAHMTAAFAVGQIAGPLLVRALATGAGWRVDALSAAHAAATVALVGAAAWLWTRT